MNAKISVWVAACLALALSACGGTSAPVAPSPAAPVVSTSAGQAAGNSASGPTKDTLQGLINGAKKEGALNLAWAQDILGGSNGVDRLTAGFQKAYGLSFKPQFTIGDNSDGMGVRLTQEIQANRPATTDAYYGPNSSLGTIKAANGLLSSNWTDWAPNIKDPAAVAPGGVAVEVATGIAGITYNTKNVTGANIPKSLMDLLKPQYKGRVATTPYAAGYERLSTPDAWGKPAALDFARKMSAQVGGLIRCNEVNRLVSGEFDILALNCNQAPALINKAKGAPLDFVIPTDAAQLTPNYLVVPKNAAHPNAAKLWINYVASPEAQAALYDLTFIDAEWVKGSKIAAVVAKYKAQGVKFQVGDFAYYDKNNVAELNNTLKEMQNILQKKA